MTKKIADKPTLSVKEELFYRAFMELEGERSSGFGVGPLPWTAIRQWAEHRGMSRDQADELAIVLNAIDNDYVSHMNKEK